MSLNYAGHIVHSACQNMSAICIILPSYDMYLITFWHNLSPCFHLRMMTNMRCHVGNNQSRYIGRDHLVSDVSQLVSGAYRCMPEGHWVLIYHPAILWYVFNHLLTQFSPCFHLRMMTIWDGSCRPAEISASHKSRPAEIMATYQVHSACQKVIECLYIILPSYDMYLITFWHSSALAFILADDDHMRCHVGRPRSQQATNLRAGRDHQQLIRCTVHARRSLSAYISSCHPMICI